MAGRSSGRSKPAPPAAPKPPAGVRSPGPGYSSPGRGPPRGSAWVRVSHPQGEDGAPYPAPPRNEPPQRRAGRHTARTGGSSWMRVTCSRPSLSQRQIWSPRGTGGLPLGSSFGSTQPGGCPPTGSPGPRQKPDHPAPVPTPSPRPGTCAPSPATTPPYPSRDLGRAIWVHPSVFVLPPNLALGPPGVRLASRHGLEIPPCSVE